MPLEVWCQILAFLPGVSLARAEAVCTLWREVISSPQSRFWSGAVRQEFDGWRLDQVGAPEPKGCALQQPPGPDTVIPFPWDNASQKVWKEEYQRRHLASRKRCCSCSADIGRNFMITPHRSRPAVCALCAQDKLLKLSVAKKMITAAGGKASKLRHGLGTHAVSEFYISSGHTAFGCARAGYYCLRWEVSALCEQLAREHAPPARLQRRGGAASKRSGATYLQKVHSVDDIIAGMRERNRERSIQQRVDASKRSALLERQKGALRAWGAACKEVGIPAAYKDISAIARSAVERCAAKGDLKDRERLQAVAGHISRRQAALAEHLHATHGITLASIATWPPLGCRAELRLFLDSLAAKSTPDTAAAAEAIANIARRELELQAACQAAGIAYSPLQWPKEARAKVVTALQGSSIDTQAVVAGLAALLSPSLSGNAPLRAEAGLLGKRCSRD